ncbi:MAG: DUF790 family protein, partial [Pyrobaculum sp.]
MIPLDYLRVVRRGREIRPRYLGDEALARKIIDAAKSSKTLGEFRKAAGEVGGDKKLARGLAHVLEQHMAVEELDTRLVSRIRLEVFKAASAVGYPQTPEERDAVFQRVAARLGLGVEEVKR